MWPQALQRGHVLLADWNGGLYVHPIAPANDDVGPGNQVIEMVMSKGGTNSTPMCSTPGLFVAVPEGGRTRVPHKEPLFPAPLARHFGKLSGLH